MHHIAVHAAPPSCPRGRCAHAAKGPLHPHLLPWRAHTRGLSSAGGGRSCDRCGRQRSHWALAAAGHTAQTQVPSVHPTNAASYAPSHSAIRAGGTRGRMRPKLRRIPAPLHTGTQAVSCRPPVGGHAIAAAESSRSWRAGRCCTHSANDGMGGSPQPHRRPLWCGPRHSEGCASGGRGGTWALVCRIPPPPPPGGTRAVAARPSVGGLVVAAASSACNVRCRQTHGRLCSLDLVDWLDGDSRRDCWQIDHEKSV